MTGEQQDHIKGINQRFTEFNHAKYTAGVKEHKDLLSSLPVTSLGIHALEEVADLVNYLYSLNDNLELIRTRLTALKEELQSKIPTYSADHHLLLRMFGLKYTGDFGSIYKYAEFTVDELEELYDPIRRVEAIERLLG